MIRKVVSAALSLLEQAFGFVVKSLTAFVTRRKASTAHLSRHDMWGPGPKWLARQGVAHPGEFFPRAKRKF
jgi:hypothetical protein